ncbi:MAG: hypothetical protein AB7S94_05330, partial [Simkaniaceae bacterium]
SSDLEIQAAGSVSNVNPSFLNLIDRPLAIIARGFFLPKKIWLNKRYLYPAKSYLLKMIWLVKLNR